MQHFVRKCQTLSRLNRLVLVYLNAELCLIDYYHDLEFLHTDSGEDPAVRVCTKTCGPAGRILLCFRAVLLCTGGNAHRPITPDECREYWFRKISFGRPDQYNVTRLFWFTSSLIAGRAA